LLALIAKEKKRVGNDAVFGPVVRMYELKINEYRNRLARYQGNMVEGLKYFQDQGQLEIITCAATHGFLPLLRGHEEAVKAQIVTGLESHENFFGRKPKGFWLPECAYEPGMDQFLSDEDIRYTFLETHGVLQASPKPRWGTFAPVVCPSGVAVFGRDLESAKQVWSSKEGYPGDPEYREFYRDVGYDLAEEQLNPYLKPDGLRRFTGLKYYRVTGPTDQKEPYRPEAALAKARVHAEDFLEKRRLQAERVGGVMDRPPLMTCLYDAELFGHWWYEGPDFIEELFRQNAKSDDLTFLTPSDYLDHSPENQATQPVFSSWGQGGYSEFWLNSTNDWIYPHLNKACSEMSWMVRQVKDGGELERRALRQAMRELLLAQASDWAFMMRSGHYADYAEKRVKIHLSRFYQLAEALQKGRISKALLTDLEEKDNLFHRLDPSIFLSES
jgi:1,4-alpha-glucan branching enzyme